MQPDCYTPRPMKQLTFQGRHYAMTAHESVLDCLLRHGQAIPYACRAGMCQACLVKAEAGVVTEESKRWIKPALQARGYTLACQWVPPDDAACSLPDVADFSVAGRIAALDRLSPTVLRVRIQPEDLRSMFAARPGQYLSLINPQGVTRAYSIANDPEQDGFVELHVAATSHGLLSHWLFETATAGSRVHLRGPSGECCYRAADMAEQPLLLAGTGTGLAPLIGIARDALAQGHQPRIDLFHGGRSAAQLYLVEELRALAAEHPNFHYHACVREGEAPPAVGHRGDLCDLVTASITRQEAPRLCAFLCGAPVFVHAMRKQLFLAGLRAQHIHCDPFTERQVVATQGETT